jgi:hypothetical protein
MNGVLSFGIVDRVVIRLVQDLRAINNMLQNTVDGTMIKKRLPLIDEGASESPAKRAMMSSSPGGLHKRLEEVINERNATTNGNN